MNLPDPLDLTPIEQLRAAYDDMKQTIRDFIQGAPSEDLLIKLTKKVITFDKGIQELMDPAEMEDEGIHVYEVMKTTIEAKGDLPVPNLFAPIDAASSSLEFGNNATHYRDNGTLASIPEETPLATAANETIQSLVRLSTATKKNDLERNQFYFQRGGFYARFQAYLTRRGSSDEWDSKKKRRKRNAGSHASLEEVASELGQQKRTTVDDSITYFEFLSQFPKFIFHPYSSLKPKKIIAFLEKHSKDENGMEIQFPDTLIRDEYLQEGATNPDLYLFSNFF